MTGDLAKMDMVFTAVPRNVAPSKLPPTFVNDVKTISILARSPVMPSLPTLPLQLPKVPPTGMNAAAKALNMSPADYQKQMESYLKTYKMEGQQGVTQLLALQKTDPTNAVLYQQMISLLSSKSNKNAAAKPKSNAGAANSSNSVPK